MFDPTAFDNIKVVLEGAIYDQDLDGDILVVDRNDWMNLAKLLKKYEISFIKGKKTHDKAVKATLIMEAGLENLASELLPEGPANRFSGCNITVTFSIKHRLKEDAISKLHIFLEEIWGANRSIEHVLSNNPLKTNLDEVYLNHLIIVSFNRLIYEHQMEDLIEMVQYMVKSIEMIESFIQ